ncbi:ATP-binding cassette domain-containing protein [Vagococcus zengguangii]|uniref:ABC transporter ATP-binding protein n=1 Tax=Vagococcus zengguangii TaxID=2571750 RepID=A0A4D7CU27_9ENTE|nr:ABC transporter ATP-binding protein [Vagococcus zengguangii]QCI86704.1 ABC transporter ATP-binding protein [Vagococcus zengguangii]TLG78460.1 ABC transporter ATP-binding protein [Vagococcus zengguangii]
MQTIKISNLYKNLSDSFHLNVSDLDLEAGKIYGLVGPNGAGKTTLMKCLCGLLRPDGGILEIDSKQVEVADSKFLSQVGTNFVNSDSLKGFSLEDIYNDHVFYYGLKNLITIEKLLDEVGLSVNKNMKFNIMSLGMKQRFLLGLSTAHNPSLVLLDEPFNGLDPDGVDLFIENVKSLSKGRVLIVSSHVLRDMETFIDDVIFIEKGNVLKSKPMFEIRNEYKEGLKDYYDEQKRKTN